MASKFTSSTASASSTIVRAPEGFRRVGSVANAGWFNMKTVGNTLHGTFEGMFSRKDELNPKKVSNFFQIQVAAPCEVRMGRGEEAQIATANVGDFVNVNYGPKTKELESLVPKLMEGAKFEVYGIVAGDKIKLTGGRTMHNFEVFKKMTQAPMVSEDAPDFGGDDDDQA
jgi:hypothetical protein